MAYEVLLLPQFVAAGLMLLLAGGLLWIDFRNSGHRAFALFLLLRALVIAANQMPLLLEPETSEYWLAIMQYFGIGVPFALAYLVLVYTWRRPGFGLRPLKILLLLSAVAVELAYAFDHSLSRAVVPDGRPRLGPLWILVTATPLAFGIVGLLFGVESTLRPPGPRRYATFLASIAFSVSAIAEGTLPLAAIVNRGFDGVASGFVPSPWLAASYASAALGVVLAITSVVLHVWQSKWDSGRRKTVGLVFGLSILAPLTSFYAEYGAPLLNKLGSTPEGAAFGPGDFLLSTILGLWRLLIPGLVTYAFVKYKLFGVDLKLKAGLRHGSVAAAFGGAYLVAFALLTIAGLSLLSSLLWAFIPMLFLGLAAAPLRWMGGRVAHVLMPEVESTPQYLARRKMQIYVAAVEEAQARGSAPAEEGFLRELRKRLGISAREDRAVLLVLTARQRYQGPKRPEVDPRFHVERELGRGSQSRALLAHDSVLERKVVLKQPLAPWMLDETGRQEFLREARLAARIRHPNVVTVYEVRPDEEPPTLVLEYVDGRSLRDVLQRNRLPLPEGVRTVLDILAGLQAIHEAGIVHRDLKPANILLDAEGMAKVTDFGVARHPDALQATVALVTSPEPGSIAYMSPEQARGVSVDKRSDLYAVGCILYEVLTGNHYLGLGNESAGLALQMVQSLRPRLIRPEIPRSLRPVLERALARDPRRRFASAREMAQALRRALPTGGQGLAAAGPASKRRVRVPSVAAIGGAPQKRGTRPSAWPMEPREGTPHGYLREPAEPVPQGFSSGTG